MKKYMMRNIPPRRMMNEKSVPSAGACSKILKFIV